MSSSDLQFFHILVIGSSECPPESNGQLPEVENIVSFMRENSDKQLYFYFIDPRHYDVPGDALFFQAYTEANVPYSIVPRNFKFETFSKEYKIGRDEEALFVDFANLGSSEYEFISRLGDRSNWHYYCPGCAGSQLNLSDAYQRARKIPRYTIHSDQPVPTVLSKAYRGDILKELQHLINYVRYLPATSKDTPPPDWFRKTIGEDRDLWTEMRVSSVQILSHFFERNRMISYNCFPPDMWYALLREIVVSA